MGKPRAFVEGGHYYDVDWAKGELVLSQRRDNGEIFIPRGIESNKFLIEGASWTELLMMELPNLAPDCTCGTEAVGGLVHSGWCDLSAPEVTNAAK